MKQTALLCKSCIRKKVFVFINLLLLMVSLTAVQAQEVVITGVVLDSKGLPIPGATIENVATGKSAGTDDKGNFKINAKVGATLRIGHLAFETQLKKVENTAKLEIRLQERATNLQDIVVVGYRSQKKETLTGAVASLKTSEIINTKSPSLAQAIQGKVAGLRIRQTDGEPGSFSNDINVRGLGTPLFVIDGVVRDGSNEFQRLNPEDIESISFLKDATAAIYGMNSANGVVIVTTKKGTKGKTTFSLSQNIGISSPTDVPQMASAGQYMTLRNEVEINAGRPPYITNEELAKWQSNLPGYQTVDLWSEITNKIALQNQTNLSFNGGSDKVSYFGSLGYANDNSILINNAINYNKYTFRSNVNMKLTDNLSGSINIGGRFDKSDKPWFNFFEIFKSTRVNPPITSVYANDNPNYYNNFAYVINPMALIDKDYTGSNVDRNKSVQTTFQLDYKVPFVDGLNLKGLLGYDFNGVNNKGIRKAFATYTYDDFTGAYTEIISNGPAMVNNYRNDFERFNIQGQATYDKVFGGKHHVSAMYVFEQRQLSANWIGGNRKFDYFSIGELNNGRSSDQYIDGSSSKEAYLSHIGRVAYDYKGKYLIDFAFRNDGSYRYAPDKRWAFFPSMSLGWRISEEDFIKNNLKFVSNWKLRSSLGRSGQDAGNAFQYLPYYSLNNEGYVFNTGAYTTGVSTPGLINNNLTWVTVDMFNIGMDLGFFKNKLTLEIDVYQRNRSGLLADRYGSLPNTFGTTLPQENLNADRTRGLDFTIKHQNNINDLNYSVGANFSLSRRQNKYIERGPFTSSYDRWRNQNVNRWTDFVWGYTVDGRFMSEDEINRAAIQNGDNGNSKELPGDYILKDLNGDGTVNDLDKVPLFWDSNPRVFFGLNFSLNWKNFDFYALFQGAAFYTVQFNEVYAEMLAFKGGNTPAYFYDRWHKVDVNNPNSEWIMGEWPAARLTQDMGSFYTRDSKVWRRDASYVRLKSLEIGYSFTQKGIKKMGISKLRAYANGNNLFTITDPFVKAFDPEKIAGSYSAGLNYPISKSFNFGLTVDF